MKKVAKPRMSESFYEYESGPQNISQMVISLSTGLDTSYQHHIRFIIFGFSPPIIVAVIVSVLSHMSSTMNCDIYLAHNISILILFRIFGLAEPFLFRAMQ